VHQAKNAPAFIASAAAALLVSAYAVCCLLQLLVTIYLFQSFIRVPFRGSIVVLCKPAELSAVQSIGRCLCACSPMWQRACTYSLSLS
jgi:hypothetical protein